ncbi:MAG: methylmalonyl-CoA/ethylmalonyl-CoA epimerase [Pseudonocardiales bacterium]|nr:methylmalonyl-CoA/ethylmalonyl-CoA epimerase [Pseudonocardiales bacterium]
MSKPKGRAMNDSFQTLHHICIVVHDIERSTAFYESIGIGPWQDYPPLSEYTSLSVPNPEAFRLMKYKLVNLGNVQLQLCEPPRLDCPQRRFLDTKGEGVFQLGFEAELDSAEADAAAVGLDVIMRGARDNGSGFVYFDTLDAAGVVLMNRKTNPIV